jgi:hypothetical protein
MGPEADAFFTVIAHRLDARRDFREQAPARALLLDHQLLPWN